MLDTFATPVRRGGTSCLRQVKQVMMLGVVCWTLTACSPEYDWRELTVAGGHARAAFPARVQTETRPVRLAGDMLDFSVSAATVNDAMFAVNVAQWPPDWAADDPRRMAVAQDIARSAYLNLQHSDKSLLNEGTSLPVDGTVMTVRGTGERAGTWSMSRVWIRPYGVVQALTIGRDDTLPVEQAQAFMGQVVVAP